MAVQRADAEPGAGSDGLERDVLARGGKSLGRGTQQLVPIAPRIDAQGTKWCLSSHTCTNGGSSSYTVSRKRRRLRFEV